MTDSNKNTVKNIKIIPFLSGYMSQWYKSPFVIGGINYQTTEHYMMAEKARLFGDDSALKKILASNTPKEAKALGRKVLNFKEQDWNKNARQIVYVANLAKFQQNSGIQTKLLDTLDAILVEGNKSDSIWAVKLDASDKKILDPTNWKGTNWLGEVLMGVRVALGGSKPYLGKKGSIQPGYDSITYYKSQ